MSREFTASPAAAPVAERRQLTVMFADLVGSTEISTRLDPEDLRQVIASYHGCVTGLVARFGGFVARYLGDGVLVYFGYPQAHEDDPERAVRAGLAIVEAVGRLDTVAGSPGAMSARVGIATGLVVVGDVIGAGSSLESPVVGDTPNLAARLQTMAAPGMVAIAETTRHLVGRLFECKELAPAHLKGLRAPVRVWAVLQENRIDSRFEALHAGYLPLVDRTEELDLLLRRWEQARAGEGRVVLLSGEPGIGKSRLIAALEQRVGRTARAHRYLCLPHHQDTALYPVLRQFERVVRFERGDGAVAKFEKLRRYLAPAPWSPTDVALFAELLSIPGADRHLIDDLSPQRKKEMVFGAVTQRFRNLAANGPLLAVLEDIHWADPTTLDLLDQLVEAVAELPVLLVVSARPESLPSWATRPHVTVQLLNALPRSYAASLVTAVTDAVTLPEEVVEQIIAHADGIPLFLEELTKTVLDSGLLRKDGERMSLVGPLSADLVPATLQASLMARLDRLAGGKEIAQIGSVIGREFSFELIQALSSWPAAQLQDALDELVRAELAIARGHPPDATYAFKHTLVQDAAYASLLRERRRAIHLRLAETLEKDPMASTEPQLVAWHFARAGQADRAIDCYLRAAQRATGRFALAEMVGCLREGLRLAEQLPDSPQTRKRELALQVALGRVLVDHQGGGDEQVRVAFERARELCHELDDTTQLIRVHDGLANYHFAHFAVSKMLQYADEMLAVGRRTGDPQAMLVAHRSAGYANLVLGRFADAAREFRLLIDTYEHRRDGPHSLPAIRDLKVSACTALGICLTVMGSAAAGAAASQDGIAHAESLNHVISLTFALRRACVQRMIQRDTGGVVSLSKRLLELSTDHETFKGSLDGAIFHCWGQLHTRQETALLHQMLTSIEQLDAARNWVMLPFFIACAAEVRGNNGDRDGAVTLLDRAIELARITGEQWCEAEIIRLQARFAAHTPEEAVRMLQASLAKAKEQGARLWELRAATSLADLWRGQGKLDAAAEALEPVYASFTEGFDTPDVLAARAMLRDLGRAPAVR